MFILCEIQNSFVHFCQFWSLGVFFDPNIILSIVFKKDTLWISLHSFNSHVSSYVKNTIVHRGSRCWTGQTSVSYYRVLSTYSELLHAGLSRQENYVEVKDEVFRKDDEDEEEKVLNVTPFTCLLLFYCEDGGWKLWTHVTVEVRVLSPVRWPYEAGGSWIS